MYMHKNTAKTKQTYYQCIHCKTEIYWNTHKKFTTCQCGAMYVDGCEDYVRIGGNEKDFRMIKK